ncbi:DUF6400 family protein [Streptomyces sp. SL13]|uniref:DUF6400 family protein n=1 Tax=Streptantibioticus silvisoli TaxID=2705255 RepID=A0AA90HB93_9ACTN|nr:DUF6400 family protein [Streptantibioticus silvisoli]MDI5965902.1 DUF6400 family protein [Streptantibioticus silvisoli]MDI5974168.1 DUF6400 family protein [Streptantibioticus silvisoli]
MTDDGSSEHISAFDIDLTREEARRQTEVIAALGPDWDPVAVLEGEREAYRLLYSGLDAGQLATYRRLEAAGVLPPLPPPAEGDGHAAH